MQIFNFRLTGIPIKQSYYIVFELLSWILVANWKETCHWLWCQKEGIALGSSLGKLENMWQYIFTSTVALPAVYNKESVISNTFLVWLEENLLFLL